MLLNVQVTKLDPIHVVMLRHTGPYEKLEAVFAQLWKWVDAHNVPASRTIGIFWDNPEFTPSAQLRSAACVEIPRSFALIATSGLNLSVEDIAGGEYATMRYVGPYEGLEKAWAEFTNYVEKVIKKSINESNPAFEVYVNDPSETPEDQLITELYMPLA